MDILKIAPDSGLHDYAVEDITVDYKAGQIKLQLLTPQSKTCEFTVDCFLEFSIQNKAPWGKGHYISWSNIQPINGDSYHLEIGLNSGDEIYIVFSNPYQERA